MVRLFRSGSNPKEIDISQPNSLVHKVHVDLDLNWSSGGEASFEIQEKLGEGSFGSVYRAIHKSSNTSIAVKEFEIFEANDVEPISKEIQILKKCNNPYVVSYFGSIMLKNKYWILMDYCSLSSFNDIMQSIGKTLKEKEISLILQQSLLGLLYLHSKQIIHRDIKSANILLDETGQVKIADFGVSQQIQSTFSKGSIAGTPYWMAPEILNQTDYNNKIDVWSLGIVAIELADGEPPLSEVNPMRAMYMIGRRPPPTFKDPKKWSPEFVSFVDKCLTKDINERWSPSQLLDHPFIKSAKPDALKELTQMAIKLKSKKRKSIGPSVSPKQQQQLNDNNNNNNKPQFLSKLLNNNNNNSNSSNDIAETTSGSVIYKPNVFSGSIDTGSVVIHNTITSNNKNNDDSGSVVLNSNTVINRSKPLPPPPSYESVILNDKLKQQQQQSKQQATTTTTTKQNTIKNKFNTISNTIKCNTILVQDKTLEIIQKTPMKNLDERNQKIVLYSTLGLILVLSVFFKFFK
ncbi:hypothetical protein ACTFIR_009656 [Dictyostelium discoideum]